MFLLKLSHLRAKRQTERVAPERERGRDGGRSFPRVTFGSAGLTTRPGCPMDGEMHFQMEIGNQAAMDHPQRGSRSEIHSFPSSQELQSQRRISKAYKAGLVPLALLAPPELTRSRNFTTKVTPFKSQMKATSHCKLPAHQSQHCTTPREP